jgi:hypothetical protein
VSALPLCSARPPWVRVALDVTASVVAGRPAAGPPYTWTGSWNGNWSTPNDWSPAGPPAAAPSDPEGLRRANALLRLNLEVVLEVLV